MENSQKGLTKKVKDYVLDGGIRDKFFHASGERYSGIYQIVGHKPNGSLSVRLIGSRGYHSDTFFLNDVLEDYVATAEEVQRAKEIIPLTHLSTQDLARHPRPTAGLRRDSNPDKINPHRQVC